jgi:intracellular multiplication protein IcmE
MPDERTQLCRSLGFADLSALHQFIVRAVRGDAAALRAKGLDAKALEELGYSRDGMRRLGCSEEQLERLGFGAPEVAPGRDPSGVPSAEEVGEVAHVRALLDRHTPRSQLKEMGITAQHCRIAGADVTQLLRLGFPMGELIHVYTLNELHRAGFNVRDLGTYFGDDELKAAGFSATEMRMAGRSIAQLQRLGYNDNHIRTAGYSLNELIMAGLAKQTRDVVRGM